jgi:hypothetical protein
MRTIFKAACALLLVAGCDAGSTSGYVPFDGAALTAAEAKARALDAFQVTLEAKDFTAIKTRYQSDFQADLKALGAAHSYVTEGSGLGVALDQQVNDAITLGAGSSATDVKEAQEELIQGIMSRYAFETVWAGLKPATRAGWDAAFAWYGRSTDGKTSAGLAGMAESRDTEFAVRKNDAVFQAFLDGRAALAKNDAAGAAVQATAIDKTLTEVFALSARHEFAEASDAIDQAKPDAAVEPYSVGRGVVAILRDYLKTLPNGVTTAAQIDAELQKGDPTQPQTMSQVGFGVILSAIDGAFGFHF